MTKTTKAASDITATVKEAIESVQEQFTNNEAARNFIAKTVADAKTQAETAQKSVLEFNGSMEKATASMFGQYAAFTKGLVDLSFTNVAHVLDTVEKLSVAKTLPAAIEIQTEAVRLSVQTNMDTLQGASETMKATMTEAANTMQNEAEKIVSKVSSVA